MVQTVLITGNSSGLGYGLSEAYLDMGWQVYGLSRRGCQGLQGALHDTKCDLNTLDEIAPALETLLADVAQLEVVYLNAGIFGELTRIAEISLERINEVMNINVWSNKVILDWLLENGIRVNQVIAISSGAAVSANKGWGSYSLSKIALNKLMQLYATEYTNTHFCALAPGLVDTAMQDYLCDESDPRKSEFPGLEKFRQARGTPTMPAPEVAARSIITAIPRLLELPSGSFADIRTM